ncbi:sugar ABC transporter ATP-binding protein [Neorhizobium sp. P12A]|uniref:sugar ABC transporter ATP-binding protein n=1 Tax=Neorhizobium sp. P12A TaxID=2268027 RepID=UPI0011F08BD4|nr:sugar ABC transporter ATP-binding protein [Neorhizobium sp. P12A]KAA0693773.1 sugar ABC transporter ATP-binding protein [Neorhizobium sp. P12A]
MTAPALEMKGIHKRFPGVYALKNVSFSVAKGSVHGLVGENGAGKSTLMRILSGAYQASEGTVAIDGKDIDNPNPEKMLALGVAVIYQELAQAPHLTVAENIYLGRLPKTSFGTVDWRKARADARAILAKLNFKVDPAARIDRLSVAQRQMVEIAKAISRDARIIVLDEPSAVLGDSELHNLFELIRTLSREEGVSFVYISHRLKELYEICQDVTVLRDGQMISSAPIEGTTTADIIRQMVGREMNDIFPSRPAPQEQIRLSVGNVNRKGVLNDISFEVRRGEIFGICGLAGSGRTEVLRAISGADRIDSGEIKIDGEKLDVRNPRVALSNGIGLLPEDRKTEGLFLDQSVAFNVTISALGEMMSGGLLRSGKEREKVANYIRQMRIKTPSGATRVRTLSGGNQQKCGIARQLNAGTTILLVDEPTRGVDVAAKREIYDLLVQLTSTLGASVVMVSSELPEVLGMCDRIMVMRQGSVSAIVDGRGATEESLMSHAVWN